MASRLHASDAKSNVTRKRIESHTFDNEDGEEYKASRFGGFSDYFRRKKIKLQNLDVELRTNSQGIPPIFRGVVAHVNGYTQPSLNDIHHLIVTYGGGFLQYLDGKTMVTHIIASNLTPKKRIEFQRYRIVKPAWVVDSVKAGKLLPWDNYRVIDEGRDQRLLGFNDGKVVSQVSDYKRSYKDQTDKSWYTDQLKEGNHEDEEQMIQVSTELSDSDVDVQNRKEASPELGDPKFYPDTEPRPVQSGRESEGQRTYMPPSPVLGIISSKDSDFTPEHQTANVHEEPSKLNSSDVPRQAAFHTESKRSTRPHTSASPPRVDSDEVDIPPYRHMTKRKESSDSSVPPAKPQKTAEEHNAALLADPNIRKMSAVNPNFIKQYYSESRLHHLSTWKANLKAEFQRMTAEQSSSQKARQKRPPGARRCILHVDFDCFFASVSLRNAPQYKDKPVVVAHGTGTGSEIASCNYPARKFGVKNGMWMKYALKVCPELKVLPYDFEAYEKVSKEFYSAIIDTGGVVESVSVDEALVDVTILCLSAGASNGTGTQEGSIWREQTKAEEIAAELRKSIEKQTGCSVSVGIGGNILQAKVALRKAKPAGQFLLKPDEVLEFMGELTVQNLPGVAHSIGGKLEEHGVKLVKDVWGLSKEKLISILGPKTGEKVWGYSRGIDRTEVGAQVERKSVSTEVNWGIRFENQEQADTFIHNLCGELHSRLKEQRVKGKQLTVKIMRRAAEEALDPPKHLGHGKCDVFNKSVVLGVATNAQDELATEALTVLKTFGFSPGELRGIGLQVTKLEPLKAAREDEVENSQRKLMFKAASSTDVFKQTENETEDIEEYPQTVSTAAPDFSNAAAEEDALVPQPVNILGTQFAVPTQIDPGVLAELPADIRAKLSFPGSAGISGTKALTNGGSRSNSPLRWPEVFPNQSQLDLETLAALPDDVKQEVLSVYQKPPSRAHNQSLLPQSPRKSRSLAPSSRKVTTPTKRRGGAYARGGRSNHDSYSTLTQSNFVLKAPATSRDDTEQGRLGSYDEQSEGVEEISTEFLDALPEGIRREVLAQHRRDRLKRRGNLDVSTTSSHSYRGRRQQQQAGLDQGSGPTTQLRLRLPARPPKATFTTKKLSTLPELREAISSWIIEFADDGPYEEDVDALAKYLGKVVLEGHDLNKAVAVVRWMDWVKDDEESGVRGRGLVGWERALGKVGDAVQKAVAERGLGPVVLIGDVL